MKIKIAFFILAIAALLSFTVANKNVETNSKTPEVIYDQGAPAGGLAMEDEDQW